jgi:hypothetical protein
MKMLSLQQPWATLAVLGIKRWETRSWQTAYRGPLAIHAAARLPAAGRALFRTEPFRTLLDRAGYPDADSLPLGAVLGVVQLVDCIPVEEVPELTPLDRAAGDFTPGRWAWQLVRPRQLLVPQACRGRLGVFDGPDLPGYLLSPPSAPDGETSPP